MLLSGAILNWSLLPLKHKRCIFKLIRGAGITSYKVKLFTLKEKPTMEAYDIDWDFLYLHTVHTRGAGLGGGGSRIRYSIK